MKLTGVEECRGCELYRLLPSRASLGGGYGQLVTLLWYWTCFRHALVSGRKKRTAKYLCVTNVTGLLLACFVKTFT